MNKTLARHHEQLANRRRLEILGIISLSLGLGSVWIVFALIEAAVAMGAII